MTINDWLKWVIKPSVFILAFVPLVLLILNALQNNLGANPIESINRSLGDWALRFLLITLTITPMRRLLNLPWLIRLRRMLGLFAFFYVCLHLLSYVVLDQFFDWGEIVKDIIKRPFITVGFFSFLLLIPLAVTSTQKWMKRLGGARWQQLHKLVYVIAIGAVVHYFWLVKADISEPLIYAGILAVLLSYRAWHFYQGRRNKRSAASRNHLNMPEAS